MNVYSGIMESSMVVTENRAPSRLMKPPPEKLAPTSMKNPPKGQTPASNGGPTCFRGAASSVHFARKKAINNVNGDTTVTMPTSRPVKLLPRKAWRRVSGNQKPTAPCSLSLRRRDQCIGDHCIGANRSHTIVNALPGSYLPGLLMAGNRVIRSLASRRND
jgi:hypothetical protein